MRLGLGSDGIEYLGPAKLQDGMQIISFLIILLIKNNIDIIIISMNIIIVVCFP